MHNAGGERRQYRAFAPNSHSYSHKCTAFVREFNGDVHRTVCWSTDRYVVGALSVVTTIL